MYVAWFNFKIKKRMRKSYYIRYIRLSILDIFKLLECWFVYKVYQLKIVWVSLLQRSNSLSKYLYKNYLDVLYHEEMLDRLLDNKLFIYTLEDLIGDWNDMIYYSDLTEFSQNTRLYIHSRFWIESYLIDTYKYIYKIKKRVEVEIEKIFKSKYFWDNIVFLYFNIYDLYYIHSLLECTHFFIADDILGWYWGKYLSRRFFFFNEKRNINNRVNFNNGLNNSMEEVKNKNLKKKKKSNKKRDKRLKKKKRLKKFKKVKNYIKKIIKLYKKILVDIKNWKYDSSFDSITNFNKKKIKEDENVVRFGMFMDKHRDDILILMNLNDYIELDKLQYNKLKLKISFLYKEILNLFVVLYMFKIYILKKKKIKVRKRKKYVDLCNKPINYIYKILLDLLLGNSKLKVKNLRLELIRIVKGKKKNNINSNRIDFRKFRLRKIGVKNERVGNKLNFLLKMLNRRGNKMINLMYKLEVCFDEFLLVEKRLKEMREESLFILLKLNENVIEWMNSLLLKKKKKFKLKQKNIYDSVNLELWNYLYRKSIFLKISKLESLIKGLKKLFKKKRKGLKDKSKRNTKRNKKSKRNNKEKVKNINNKFVGKKKKKGKVEGDKKKRIKKKKEKKEKGYKEYKVKGKDDSKKEIKKSRHYNLIKIYEKKKVNYKRIKLRIKKLKNFKKKKKINYKRIKLKIKKERKKLKIFKKKINDKIYTYLNLKKGKEKEIKKLKELMSKKKIRNFKFEKKINYKRIKLRIKKLKKFKKIIKDKISTYLLLKKGNKKEIKKLKKFKKKINDKIYMYLNLKKRKKKELIKIKELINEEKKSMLFKDKLKSVFLLPFLMNTLINVKKYISFINYYKLYYKFYIKIFKLWSLIFLIYVSYSYIIRHIYQKYYGETGNSILKKMNILGLLLKKKLVLSNRKVNYRLKLLGKYKDKLYYRHRFLKLPKILFKLKYLLNGLSINFFRLSNLFRLLMYWVFIKYKNKLYYKKENYNGIFFYI